MKTDIITFMDKESLAFIEKMELFWHDAGMPRSLARVIGYLLICEPVAQSAKDIREVLKLSTGAVSNALAILRSSGMVRPVSVPGVRSMLYEIDSNSWKRNAIQRLKASSQALEVAGEGLRLKPGNDRIKAMYRLYEVFDREAEVLIAKLEEIE
jgi:DNA-binding transcriptional regulator GbsR (MarR family)